MEERHARDPIGAILPRVICAALNDDVTLFQHHFGVVEYENGFTLDHQHVVQRFRAVHYGALATPLQRVDIDDAEQMACDRRGRHTLYAINHGGRESVEVFSIDARGVEPRLTWTGCAVLTVSAWLNAVVPLPDGGFIVTSTFDPKDPQAQTKMANGRYAGAVYEWQPRRGFAPLAGADHTGDNGVAISGDARWLYFNWFFGRAVIRVARGGGAARATATLDFLPDNIDHAPDGSLYVTGQNADPKTAPHRLSRWQLQA